MKLGKFHILIILAVGLVMFARVAAAQELRTRTGGGWEERLNDPLFGHRQVALRNGKMPNSIPTAMPLVAPLFVEDAQFTSTLVLVNAGTSSALAEVILRGPSGDVIARKHVVVPGDNRLDLAVGMLVKSVGSAETTGSVVVVPQSKTIVAALSLTDRTETPSYLDEELSMPMPTSSALLRAATDHSTASPIVAITSLTKTAQHVAITCLKEQGKPFTKVVELAPNATLITLSCSEMGRSNSDFESPTLSANRIKGGAFGIELKSDGPPGSFAAFGLAQHRKGEDEYFSTISFADPMMEKSSTTVFTGVPVGSASLLPAASYTPIVALANFGVTPAHVRVTLATTNADNPWTATAADLQVAAGQSKLVKLEGLSGNDQMLNSFIVKSDTGPGQLMVKLSASSDGPLNEVEMLGKDAESGYNGGAHPWSISDGSESTLLLFNDSTDTQIFNVAIGDVGRKPWEKAYTLKSMETVAINIPDLIRAQVKDDHGDSLPATLTEGDVLWNAPVNAGQGRLLQSDTTIAMARSFSCNTFYFICDLSINGTTSGNVGDTFYETAEPTICIDNGLTNTCTNNGGQTQMSISLNYNWSPGSTILQDNCTVDCGADAEFQAVGPGQTSVYLYAIDQGNCTQSAQQPVTVKPKITNVSPARGLVGVGTPVTITGTGFVTGATIQAGPNISVSNTTVDSATQISATFTPTNQTDSGGSWNVSVDSGGQTSTTNGTFYVQIPTSLQVKNVSIIPNGATNGCTTTETGIRVDVNYQVVDQHTPSGMPIASSSMVPHETVGNKGGNIVPNTNANGTFDDTPVGVCGTTSFTTSIVQAIEIVVKAVAYTGVRTNNYTIKGTTAGHGSITNGSDINKTR